MDRRGSHTGKSRPAREAYSRYIKTLDYEPTAQEGTPFERSSESGEEFKEPTSARKRQVKIGQRIKDHFLNNWLNWAVGVVIVVLFFLMVDSKVDLARIGSTIDAIKENVKSLIIESKTQGNKIHEQDLSIRENSLRIQQIEKQYDKKR